MSHCEEIRKMSATGKLQLLEVMLKYPQKPKYIVYAGNVFGFMSTEVDEFLDVEEAKKAIEKGKLQYFGKGDFRFFNKAKRMGIWFYTEDTVYVFHNNEWEEYTKEEFREMNNFFIIINREG
jgi:hypothetical protein